MDSEITITGFKAITLGLQSHLRFGSVGLEARVPGGFKDLLRYDWRCRDTVGSGSGATTQRGIPRWWLSRPTLTAASRVVHLVNGAKRLRYVTVQWEANKLAPLPAGYFASDCP